MNNEIIKTVCETLKIDESFAKNNYKEIKGLNAYYFWTQGRGGAQMIIGTDGERERTRSRSSYGFVAYTPSVAL